MSSLRMKIAQHHLADMLCGQTYEEVLEDMDALTDRVLKDLFGFDRQCLALRRQEAEVSWRDMLHVREFLVCVCGFMLPESVREVPNLTAEYTRPDPFRDFHAAASTWRDLATQWFRDTFFDSAVNGLYFQFSDLVALSGSVQDLSRLFLIEARMELDGTACLQDAFRPDLSLGEAESPCRRLEAMFPGIRVRVS